MEKSIHVAFIVRGKDVVTWAPNRFDVHAEVNAVEKALRAGVRPGFDLYVVRYMRKGAQIGECVLGESRPCSACSIYLSRRANVVKNVYWSNAEGDFEKERGSKFREFA